MADFPAGGWGLDECDDLVSWATELSSSLGNLSRTTSAIVIGLREQSFHLSVRMLPVETEDDEFDDDEDDSVAFVGASASSRGPAKTEAKDSTSSSSIHVSPPQATSSHRSKDASVVANEESVSYIWVYLSPLRWLIVRAVFSARDA